MKFSVIISVYINDNPVYFDEALSSIINQTMPPSEIILVIDGKVKEGIESVIKNYVTKYRNLINVKRLNENQGHAKARQIGVDSTSNEWIAVMDSDDVALSDRFEKQSNYLINNPNVDVLGGQIEEFIDHLDNVVGIRQVPLTDEKIKEYLKIRCPFNQQTVMMRKSSMLTAGGYIDWHYEEDYYLWIRMYKSGFIFRNMPDTLVKVRVGNEMYNRRGGIKYYLSEKELQKYMYNNGIINQRRYIYNVAIRFIVQVMLPNSLRSLIFQKLFRTQKNNSENEL